MKATRIGVIGLGQRIAHVLGAMKEVGWNIDLAGYVDPAPVGAPILKDFDIAMGKSYPDPQMLLKDGAEILALRFTALLPPQVQNTVRIA